MECAAEEEVAWVNAPPIADRTECPRSQRKLRGKRKHVAAGPNRWHRPQSSLRASLLCQTRLAFRRSTEHRRVAASSSPSRQPRATDSAGTPARVATIVANLSDFERTSAGIAENKPKCRLASRFSRSRNSVCTPNCGPPAHATKRVRSSGRPAVFPKNTGRNVQFIRRHRTSRPAKNAPAPGWEPTPVHCMDAPSV